MSGIWAIVLAAGESKRMGFPKMLLNFNGKSMLENVIENISGSHVKDIIIVLGAHMDKLLSLVKNADVKHCYNENYKEGMLSSVICGLIHTPPDIRAVLVFQGDQPLIKPAVTNLVIEAYKTSGKGIVIPVYNKKRGHPILIDNKYRNEITKLDPDKGLRELSLLNAGDVQEVETNEPGILRDFDTYEDYKLEINK